MWVLGVQRGWIVIGSAAGIAWMAALAAIPIVLGAAIERGVVTGEAGAVAWWVFALVGVVLVEAVAGVVRHHAAMRLYVRTRWLLEQQITDRVLDPRGGATDDAGSLVAHAENDAQKVGAIADLMCRGAGAVVTFVAVGVGMVLTSPLLGVVVLVGLPLSMGVLVPLWRPNSRRAAEQQVTFAATSSTAADVLAGLRVVKGLGATATVRGWFAAGVADVERSAVRLARLGGLWQALTTVIPGVFLAVVLGVGGSLAVDGAVNVGALVAFTGLAVFLAIPLATLAEVGDVWASGLAGAGRIASVLNEPFAVADDSRSTTWPSAGSVEFDDVTCATLRSFSLVIPEAQMIGVACADSAEADVLVALLARRIDADRGSVLVGGIDVRAMSLEVSRTVVLVESGHDPWLTDGSVADNVALGAPGAAVEDLDGALRAAAAEDLIALHGAVGERGLSLSGGQRQRVAMARAVAANPLVLVLDDPTSSLDSITEQRVIERVAAARHGRTTIAVSTSPTVLARCDRVVLVEAGTSTKAGTHDELLSDDRYRDVVAAATPSGEGS